MWADEGDEVDDGLFDEARRQREELDFFMGKSLGPEIHWFFHQGVLALRHRLYLPACTTLLNGIESSLRITHARLDSPGVGDLELGTTLCNRLLRDLKAKDVPVNLLAFSGEGDFDDRLRQNAPHVRIVQVRHDLCHGNVAKYVDSDLGPHERFFTPECLRDLAEELHTLSRRWVSGLASFRENRLAPGSP